MLKAAFTYLLNVSVNGLNTFTSIYLCLFILQTVSLVPTIRFRICQFVNLLLNALGTEAALDDAICDDILKYMYTRAKVC